MDLTQILTILGSVAVPVVLAIAAGLFAFYKMTQGEIAVIRDQTNDMNKNHREDMKDIMKMWGELFVRMDNKMSHSEAEWKRLYEKFVEGKRQA